MGRRSRAEQQQETRERLLASAARVFAERGFHAASIDEIAEDAGFTKGAVYSNFTSKEELFLSLLERQMDRRLEDVRAQFDTAATLADIREGGRRLGGLMAEDRDLWLLLLEFVAYAARQPRLQEALARQYERWRTQIGALISEQLGELDLPLPAAPADVASAAIALGEGFSLQRLIDPDRVTDERYGDSLAMLVAGIAVTGMGLDVDDLDALRSSPAS